MVRRHLLGTSASCLLDRLFDDARHEQLQCFRCSVRDPSHWWSGQYRRDSSALAEPLSEAKLWSSLTDQHRRRLRHFAYILVRLHDLLDPSHGELALRGPLHHLVETLRSWMR